MVDGLDGIMFGVLSDAGSLRRGRRGLHAEDEYLRLDGAIAGCAGADVILGNRVESGSRMKGGYFEQALMNFQESPLCASMAFPLRLGTHGLRGSERWIVVGLYAYREALYSSSSTPELDSSSLVSDGTGGYRRIEVGRGPNRTSLNGFFETMMEEREPCVGSEGAGVECASRVFQCGVAAFRLFSLPLA
jgi:hypothetical protein